MKRLIFIIAVLCFAAGVQAGDEFDSFKRSYNARDKEYQNAKTDVNGSLVDIFCINVPDVAHAFAFNEKTFKYFEERLSFYIQFFEAKTAVCKFKSCKKGAFDAERAEVNKLSLIFNAKDKNPVYDQYHFEKFPGTGCSKNVNSKSSSGYDAAVNNYKNLFDQKIKDLNNSINWLESDK